MEAQNSPQEDIVAKSNKYSSKVPSLEQYKFPFLNEDGEIEDVEAAKKAFHTLMVDKAKAQDAREDAQAEVATVTAERDELQTKVDDKNAPDAKVEIERANTRASKAEADAKKERDRADRLEVAIDKGLTPNQAKRLVGETKEELEADAEELLKDFGGSKENEDDDEDEDELPARTTPRRKDLTNPADANGGGSGEVDYDKIVAGFDTRIV